MFGVFKAAQAIVPCLHSGVLTTGAPSQVDGTSSASKQNLHHIVSSFMNPHLTKHFIP